MKSRLFHDEENNRLVNINKIQATDATYKENIKETGNVEFEIRFFPDCEDVFIVKFNLFEYSDCFFTGEYCESFLKMDEQQEKSLRILLNKAIKKMIKKIAKSKYSTTKDLVNIADKTIKKHLSRHSAHEIL
jgi:hypothetical protein